MQTPFIPTAALPIHNTTDRDLVRQVDADPDATPRERMLADYLHDAGTDIETLQAADEARDEICGELEALVDDLAEFNERGPGLEDAEAGKQLEALRARLEATTERLYELGETA